MSILAACFEQISVDIFLHSPLTYDIMSHDERGILMKMMVDYAHDFLSEVLSPHAITVDFTCGNGHDTLFLAKRSAHVYAMDIQKDVIEQTQERFQTQEIKNVSFFHHDHGEAVRVIPYYDAGIFSLGYLPQGNRHIVTKGESTLKALRQALDLLKPHGRLVLVVYTGHKEGLLESEQLNKFVEKLSPHDFHCASLRMENKKASPYLLIIDRVDE